MFRYSFEFSTGILTAEFDLQTLFELNYDQSLVLPNGVELSCSQRRNHDSEVRPEYQVLVRQNTNSIKIVFFRDESEVEVYLDDADESHFEIYTGSLPIRMDKPYWLDCFAQRSSKERFDSAYHDSEYDMDEDSSDSEIELIKETNGSSEGFVLSCELDSPRHHFYRTCSAREAIEYSEIKKVCDELCRIANIH